MTVKFYCKNANFFNTMQKILPKNFLPLSRNTKNEIISLSYDVNDNVYPNQNPLNFVVKIQANIQVKILANIRTKPSQNFYKSV